MPEWHALEFREDQLDLRRTPHGQAAQRKEHQKVSQTSNLDDCQEAQCGEQTRETRDRVGGNLIAGR